MTVLFHEGFDGYAGWTDFTMVFPLVIDSAHGGTLSTSAGRFGGGCIYTTWQGPYMDFPLSSQTDFWFGCAMSTISGGNSNDGAVFKFLSGTGVEDTIQFIKSTGTIKWYRGDSSTLLGSSSASVFSAAAGWHWFEARLKFDGSAGVCEIWWDGVQVLNLTAQNTKQNGSETGITRIQIFDPNGGTGQNWKIDDIYAATTRLGDCRIALLVPTSDASPNNGTPSSGSTHYTMVNEVPGYNTSNYNSLANTTGQEERFGIGAAPTTPDIIYSVAVISVAEKTDAGAAAAHNEVVSGGVVGSGSSWSLSTSWGFKKDYFLTDPNTSAAWTASALSALKVGYVVE